jgi:acyl CoA:acetate/3-ketoacid CoA transferase alpha subunit/acyl CoA:acetate/3-ketoacid CoA transferase beta subunit
MDFMKYCEIADQPVGDDKVVPLQQAVARLVHPGMTLHISFPSYHRPNAIIREIARQYWGKSPEFTVMCVGLGVQNNAHVLFHGGLIRKAIATFFGDVYPTPGPNPIIQKAFVEGRVTFEHWSILAYAERLLAGALGIGFMPTNSMVGSNMAEDNRDDFLVMDDPFEPGVKRGLVRAIHPDLSLYHALAADRYGNAIIAPPYSENTYGAFASRGGVLLTVEKIVSDDFIKKNSHMVKIPAHVVKSVSVVPWGAHPLGISASGVDDVEMYAEDYEYLAEARKVCRDPKRFEEWIRHWILDCPDQETYLQRLGRKRILNLKGKTRPDAWKFEVESSERVEPGTAYSALEMMIVALSRSIEEKILQNRYDTILAGIGQSNLASWLANYRLRKNGYPINLIAEIGMYGYAPRPGDPFIFNHGNIPTARMLTDSFGALGMMVSGENNRCIGALGAAMVDRHGNLNSTVIPPAILISGAGGGNDTASGAREVVVAIQHGPGRLVEKVNYVTSPGARVRTVVTTLGIFEKLNDDTEFTLTRLLPNPENRTAQETLQAIRENTGWEVQVAEHIGFVEPPNEEDLSLLRSFDPQRFFLK